MASGYQTQDAPPRFHCTAGCSCPSLDHSDCAFLSSITVTSLPLQGTDTHLMPGSVLSTGALGWVQTQISALRSSGLPNLMGEAATKT